MGPDPNKFFRHWNIKRPVFTATPPIDKPFLLESYDKIISATDVLGLGTGVLLLTGEAGSGKTTLANWLQYRSLSSRKKTNLIHVNQSITTPNWLLVQIGRFFEDEVDGPITKASEILKSLEDHLNQYEAQTFILDICGRTTDDKFWNDLHSIHDLSLTTRSSVNFVVFADEETSFQLKNSPIASLVTMETNIPKLNTTETVSYAQWRLEQRGLSKDTFTPPALKRLARESHGNFSLLNRLAEQSMFVAFLGGKRKITTEHVQKALPSIPKNNTTPKNIKTSENQHEGDNPNDHPPLEYFYIETDAG